MKKISGIYCIENILNGMKYIGQTTDMRKRKRQHASDLKRNSHHNNYLQHSYNQHGEENFKFSVILYCEPFELTRYEDSIEKYNRPNCYNTRECSDSNFGMKMSSESKEKMSKAKKGKAPPNKGIPMTEEAKLMRLHSVNIGMLGKHHTPESIDKIEDSNRGKKRKNHSSKYIGVLFDKSCNRWIARIKHKNKDIFFSRLETEIEAAMAYNEAAIEFYGFKAKLNYISEEEIKALWESDI